MLSQLISEYKSSKLEKPFSLLLIERCISIRRSRYCFSESFAEKLEKETLTLLLIEVLRDENGI